MAKREISKHSRAARRAEAEAPEVSELSKLPRAANKPDIANYIVRTTNKNEELLQQKLEKNKKSKAKKSRGITKDQNGGISKRGIDFGSKLSTKIQKSIHKGLLVSRRKMTWEQINEETKKEQIRLKNQEEDSKKKKKSSKRKSKLAEFYGEESDDNDIDNGNDLKPVTTNNTFALLQEDVEA